MFLDHDRVPSCLDDAVECLLDCMDDEDREIVKKSKPIEAHHALGRTIRNQWSLWDKDTVLVRWFDDNLGVSHADDISGIIVEATWAEVNGHDFSPEKKARQCREHWANLG